MLEEMPQSAGLQLPAMYLSGQKSKIHTESQTEEVVGFADLKHLKEYKLKPHILKHGTKNLYPLFLSPPDENRGP